MTTAASNRVVINEYVVTRETIFLCFLLSPHLTTHKHTSMTSRTYVRRSKAKREEKEFDNDLMTFSDSICFQLKAFCVHTLQIEHSEQLVSLPFIDAREHVVV